MIRRLIATLLLVPALAGAGPRIAIIIDDLGYSRERGLAVTALPAGVTCAVIPEAPWSPMLAERAESSGKEVMLHLPMETEADRPLDAGALDTSMDRDAYHQVLDRALQRIPQAVGVNNHMGSTLTARPEPMDWLMEALAGRSLYFVDSRTTPDSVAETIARRRGLRAETRDVFLDNDTDLLSINARFNELIRIARRNGQAIGIGHPYPETISYLRKVLPLLREAGIEVVPASALVRANKHLAPTQVAHGAGHEHPANTAPN